MWCQEFRAVVVWWCVYASPYAFAIQLNTHSAAGVRHHLRLLADLAVSKQSGRSGTKGPKLPTVKRVNYFPHNRAERHHVYHARPEPGIYTRPLLGTHGQNQENMKM